MEKAVDFNIKAGITKEKRKKRVGFQNKTRGLSN